MKITYKYPCGYDCHQIGKEVAVKMYINMVTLQVMDTIFYEAQRQGRISFYVTQIGEEAINIASAAALNIDDLVFPQVSFSKFKALLYHIIKPRWISTANEAVSDF